ncbi:MAG: cytochrome C biogenesis protein [Elusimicrobia bacterium RIFOXYB2_FULL_49_7]|nr:MAG: cytochrome C biogenesis protein [Elusimicrobia bacterium RIFOXYB2_FULL_49_7]
MVELFTWLSNILYATPALALLGSLLWGILSILLSPCHLASIPLIVGVIYEQGRMSTTRAFYLSSLFSSGILITIGLIGVITGLMGRMMGDVGPYGNYFVAAVFFLVGLHLLDVLPLPFIGKAGQPAFKKKGLLAAFILGLVFGIALGPCTFAFMAPMLGMAFSVASTNFVFAVSLVAAYAVGHVSVIILAGTFTGVVQSYLNWNERSKGVIIVKRVCGLLVILGGAYLLYTVKN